MSVLKTHALISSGLRVACGKLRGNVTSRVDTSEHRQTTCKACLRWLRENCCGCADCARGLTGREMPPRHTLDCSRIGCTGYTLAYGYAACFRTKEGSTK